MWSPYEDTRREAMSQICAVPNACLRFVWPEFLNCELTGLERGDTIEERSS